MQVMSVAVPPSPQQCLQEYAQIHVLLSKGLWDRSSLHNCQSIPQHYQLCPQLSISLQQSAQLCPGKRDQRCCCCCCLLFCTLCLVSKSQVCRWCWGCCCSNGFGCCRIQGFCRGHDVLSSCSSCQRLKPWQTQPSPRQGCLHSLLLLWLLVCLCMSHCTGLVHRHIHV